MKKQFTNKIVLLAFIPAIISCQFRQKSNQQDNATFRSTSALNDNQTMIYRHPKKLYLDDIKINEASYSDSIFYDTIRLKDYVLCISPADYKEYFNLLQKYSTHISKIPRVFYYSNFDKERYEFENLKKFKDLVRRDSNCLILRLNFGQYDTLCNKNDINAEIPYEGYYFSDLDTNINSYIFYLDAFEGRGNLIINRDTC